MTEIRTHDFLRWCVLSLHARYGALFARPVEVSFTSRGPLLQTAQSSCKLCRRVACQRRSSARHVSSPLHLLDKLAHHGRADALCTSPSSLSASGQAARTIIGSMSVGTALTSVSCLIEMTFTPRRRGLVAPHFEIVTRRARYGRADQRQEKRDRPNVRSDDPPRGRDTAQPSSARC
jgi:hypothetical protein